MTLVENNLKIAWLAFNQLESYTMTISDRFVLFRPSSYIEKLDVGLPVPPITPLLHHSKSIYL